MVDEIWQFKLQILPILLFLLIYETPALLRKLKKTFYVPIYFSIYPLRGINQDLSEYLGEDHFYGQGEKLTDEEAESLRKKIIFTSIMSGVIDGIIIPLFIGFIAAFFLSKELFFQFVMVLFFYKIIAIIFSLIESHLHFIEGSRKLIFLVFIYAIYLGIITEMLKTSYNWATPFLKKGDWLGLWNSFSGYIFGTILAQGFVFAIFVGIFTNYISDRKLREQNLSQDDK